MRPRECGHGGVVTASLDTGNDLPYAWFKADFEFQEKYFRDGNQYPIGAYAVKNNGFCRFGTHQRIHRIHRIHQIHWIQRIQRIRCQEPRLRTSLPRAPGVRMT